MAAPTIGVLALQGDFREHARAVRECGAEATEVRKAGQLEQADGLIIPGGESTTIGKLMLEYGFDQAIPAFAAAGRPVYGTCAGLILLAREIHGSPPYEAGGQFRLGLMDTVARRNAYGRQRESFEAEVPVPALGPEPLRIVFIRAPYIESVGPGVDVLATHAGKIVMARQGNCLASAFHPELTADRRVHRYFLQMVESARRTKSGVG